MEYIEVPILSECFAKGKKPEYLFWVGCLGSIDDRAKKISRAFCQILSACEVDYAILGKEETCCGDPVRRAGNEMLYQMQALTIIEMLKMYEVKKIVTFCPHCFNTFKNEYPDLDAEFEVIHSTIFLENLVEQGKLKINPDIFNKNIITYHDACYLGRANNIYDTPRNLIDKLTGNRTEMNRCRSYALCCGAGGAQMFKEAEKGNKEIFIERIEEVLEIKADIIATACPYCMVMLSDGIKYKNEEEKISNYDIIELIAKSLL
ncbi:MAG: (Fe-S)-binding protein [Bacteroidetes bacterium]|nr:(Fe-S)-binding protein [Bacteroidota bacterium]